MSKNPLLWVLLIVIVIVGIYGAFRLYRHFARQVTQPAPETNLTSQTPSASESGRQNGSPSAQTQGQHIVQITAAGFSPAIITIHPGDTVTWVNIDNQQHTVNSDPHPTHTLYPPLNTVGLLNPGEQKSLTFPTSGTFKYHDHLNPSLRGSVVVQ